MARKTGAIVTLQVREATLERDGYRCLAPQLDPLVNEAECKTAFGQPMAYPGGYHVADLEMHHVKDQPAMGVKGDHLATVCPWHHRYSGWGTSKRGLERLREHIRRKANPISSPAVGAGTDEPEPVQLAFPKKGAHL